MGNEADGGFGLGSQKDEVGRADKNNGVVSSSGDGEWTKDLQNDVDDDCDYVGDDDDADDDDYDDLLYDLGSEGVEMMLEDYSASTSLSSSSLLGSSSSNSSISVSRDAVTRSSGSDEGTVSGGSGGSSGEGDGGKLNVVAAAGATEVQAFKVWEKIGGEPWWWWENVPPDYGYSSFSSSSSTSSFTKNSNTNSGFYSLPRIFLTRDGTPALQQQRKPPLSVVLKFVPRNSTAAVLTKLAAAADKRAGRKAAAMSTKPP
jgi:hypothetical protein